jgi:hypothetical protein
VTVASELNRVVYTGNGVTTAFAVSFPFQSASDLIVIETVIATGVQTAKTLTTHYTISGTTDSLGYYSSGGTVTAVVAPASTVRWTIYRAPSMVQSLNLSENNALPAESLEAQLDYLTMLIQRVSDRVNRSLRQPDGDSANVVELPSAVTRASKFLGFDAEGNPLATSVTSPGVVSAFMLTVLDDATAAAALTTLGIPLTAFPAYTQSGNVDSSATGYFDLPSGTTAQRPGSPNSGMVRYNSTTQKFEGYGTAWGLLGGGAQGAGVDAVFYENDQTVTGDYSITSGKNAMSAGPITISSGVTVTVTSGCTWTVV